MTQIHGVTRKERIESALSALDPVVIEVVDESHKHKNGRESHYNATVVCRAFGGLGRVDRHRRVHALLAAELAAGLHALTLTLRTPEEHEALGGSIASPACLGGGR